MRILVRVLCASGTCLAWNTPQVSYRARMRDEKLWQNKKKKHAHANYCNNGKNALREAGQQMVFLPRPDGRGRSTGNHRDLQRLDGLATARDGDAGSPELLSSLSSGCQRASAI